jgi:K+-sensing histidine kinase KdpD
MSNTSKAEKTETKGIVQTKWIVLLIVLVAIIGIVMTIWVGRIAEETERADLLAHSEITARAIDMEDIDELTGTIADIESPQYQKLKKILIDIKAVESDVRFVYLMGLRNIDDGKFFFYVDSEIPGTDGYSAPGDIYEDTDQIQLDAFHNQKGVTEGPYKDSFGSWVSGFAPLVDPATGKTTALVGTDISSSHFQQIILIEKSVPAIIAFAIILLLLLYLYFSKKTNRFIARIKTSEEEAEEQRNRLRSLYEISTRKEVTIPEQFRAALKTGNVTLYTKMAMLNRIEDSKFTVLYAVVPPETVHEGDIFKLAETYCDITVKADDVVAISAMSISEYKAHICYTKFKLESYIGVPVKVHGALFGTLTFLDPDPHRPTFTESDKDFVRLMGAWMSSTLEREEIDKMKSEFVSVASHQLRTPLTGIKWFTDLMLRGKAGEVTADQKDFLTQISDSNERMIKLVEDLLNVSRIEAGSTKFVITKKTTDIVPILDSLATDLVGLEQKHKVKIIRDTDFPKTLNLNVDAEKIRQVFANLLSNAVKYSHEGGEVHIKVDSSDSKFTTFSISDTGLGIPTKDQGRMFEKFFRAENVQTKETDGTGLGLYVVKAIVEGHSGTLRFESKENVGTTFFISLLKN